jgi:hypothetical protein
VLAAEQPAFTYREGRDITGFARVETSVDGKELEIFRRSVPFGTALASRERRLLLRAVAGRAQRAWRT